MLLAFSLLNSSLKKLAAIFVFLRKAKLPHIIFDSHVRHGNSRGLQIFFFQTCSIFTASRCWYKSIDSIPLPHHPATLPSFALKQDFYFSPVRIVYYKGIYTDRKKNPTLSKATTAFA